MYCPIRFSFRENQLMLVVEVVGECDQKYSYIYLLNSALSIISLAEVCCGRLIPPNHENTQATDKNTINFSIIFPNKYKMLIFRELMEEK